MYHEPCCSAPVWKLDEKLWLGPGGTLPSAGWRVHLRLRPGRGGSLGHLERGEKSPPPWQAQDCHRSDEFWGLSFLHHHHILPKNQPVDRLHLSSAQLIPGPTARNVPTCHPGVLSVLDQADESGTLVPQTAGMCVTECEGCVSGRGQCVGGRQRLAREGRGFLLAVTCTETGTMPYTLRLSPRQPSLFLCLLCETPSCLGLVGLGAPAPHPGSTRRHTALPRSWRAQPQPFPLCV